MRLIVAIGDETHDVGVLIGDPNTSGARELIARMIIDWARDYAGEDADLDD